MDTLNERAATVPGWPGGPDLVHLVYRFALPDVAERWVTMCPAGGDGMPDGAHRKVTFTMDRIDCDGCRHAAPDIVEQVDGVNAAVKRRRHRASVQLAAFLRWLDEEKQVVLADYAGGVQLKAYPSHFHDGLIQEWLAGRPPNE